MADRYFSDEELTAFLDGEKEFAPMDEIRAALKFDPALQRRLSSLKIDRRQIKENFQHLSPGMIPQPKLPDHAPSRISNLGIAAGFLIAAVIGFGVGSFDPQSQPKDWKAYVAAYQALYTNSTLVHVQADSIAQQDELQRVSAAIGKSINLSNLNIGPEVEYKRAQILGFEGKALIQLAFLTSTGEPMALCIIRSDNNVSQAINFAVMEELNSAFWSTQGYNYLLIGGNDQSLLSRLANTLRTRKI